MRYNIETALRQHTMKRFLLIITLIAFGSQLNCSANSKYQLFESNKRDLRYLKDSLTNSKVDTIFCYYRGCASCMCGVQEITYVFWIKDGIYHLASPYRIWYKRKIPNKIPDYFLRYGNVMKEFNFDWIKSLCELASKETLNEGKFSTLNYSFEELNIKIGNYNFSLSLADYDRLVNIDKYQSILIDKLLLWILNSYLVH